MDNIFSNGNNWVLSGMSSGWTGMTWIANELEDNDYVSDLRNNYFSYQKCISGVTYKYVISLNDIYNKGLSSSDSSYYVQNFYNEYDVISKYMTNFSYVDVCAGNSDIQLNKRQTKIDGVLLKTGMRVLVINHPYKPWNGIYELDYNGYLIIQEDEIATVDKSYRYSVYIKSGDVYKGKQFFLLSSSTTYPTTYETKDFVLGRSHIVKNRFTYNLFQTGTTSDIVPKLLFTDYEIARHSLGQNAELYDIITDSSVLAISYDIGTGGTFAVSDLGTSASVTGDISHIEFDSGHTIIRNATLYTSHVNKYVQFTINHDSLPSDTYLLKYFTFLHEVKPYNSATPTSGVVGIDQIPTYVYSDIIKKYTGCTYTVKISDSDNVYRVENMTPFSKFMYYSGGTTEIAPMNNDSFYYIDFCDLSIDGTSFSTDNLYIKYTLYNQLNTIDSSFDATYEIKTPPGSGIVPTSTGLTSGGTYIQLDTTDTDYFVKNTYAYVNNDTDNKTLIVDVISGSTVYIETGKTWTFDTITEINTLYQLSDVSSILYNVYKNTEGSYYTKRPDNQRRDICGAYGDILSTNLDITGLTTGIILQNTDSKFELRLFNTECYGNNGNDSGSTTMDKNLVYIPTDLLKVGFDKKTAFPLPIFSENIQSSYKSGTTVF